MKIFTPLRLLLLIAAISLLLLPTASQARDNHGGFHGGGGGNRGGYRGGGYRGGYGGGGYRGGYHHGYYRHGYGGFYGYPYVGIGFGYPYYGYGNGYGDPYYDGPGYGYRGSVYYGRTASDAGSSDELTVDVQRALKRRGYYSGAVDGEIGAGSRSALRNFQSAHRLDVTGRIDRPTLRALGL